MRATPADHRRRLLDGLEAAIREKGLAAVQVTDIVGHARASRTTFYRCFADKEDCFLALGEARFAEARERVAAAVDPSAPWQTQVDQAIDAFFGLLEEDRASLVVFNNELPTLGARGIRFRAEVIERNAHTLLALAAAAGLEQVPVETAVMLAAGIEEVIARAVAREESITALAPVVKETVRRALAPPAAEPTPTSAATGSGSPI
jgi:AcrR family transcriptional regulator